MEFLSKKELQLLNINVAKLKHNLPPLKTIYYDYNKKNLVASNTHHMIILNKDLNINKDLYIEPKTLENIYILKEYPQYFRIIPSSFKNEFKNYDELINFSFETEKNNFYKFNINDKKIISTMKFIFKNCTNIKYFFCGLVFKIEFELAGIKGIYLTMPLAASESSPANFNKLKFEKNIDIFLLQKVENSIVDPPTNFLENRCGFGFCLKSE